MHVRTMSKRRTSRKINQLAKIRRQMNDLRDRAEMLSLQLIKHGGGESQVWIAEVARVKAHVVNIRAHDRLVLTPK